MQKIRKKIVYYLLAMAYKIMYNDNFKYKFYKLIKQNKEYFKKYY